MNDLMRFLAENKIWWITPIVIVLALVAWVVFVDAGATPEGGTPFHYDHY